MFGRRMIQDGRYSQHSLNTEHTGNASDSGGCNFVNPGNPTAQF